jgi:hypothetical protein
MQFRNIPPAYWIMAVCAFPRMMLFGNTFALSPRTPNTLFIV